MTMQIYLHVSKQSILLLFTITIGHSLGGGIALISGAQAHVKAIGLSAPNTVLGRDTVDPKLSLDDLQRWTFNIVPERGETGC